MPAYQRSAVCRLTAAARRASCSFDARSARLEPRPPETGTGQGWASTRKYRGQIGSGNGAHGCDGADSGAARPPRAAQRLNAECVPDRGAQTRKFAAFGVQRKAARRPPRSPHGSALTSNSKPRALRQLLFHLALGSVCCSFWSAELASQRPCVPGAYLGMLFPTLVGNCLSRSLLLSCQDNSSLGPGSPSLSSTTVWQAVLECTAMAHLFALAVAVAVAAGAYQVFRSSSDSSSSGAVPGFEVIGPGARRRSILWQPVPYLQVPVATFLLEVPDEAGGLSSVLVDAGVPDKTAIAQLVGQLRAATSIAPLRLLIGNAATCSCLMLQARLQRQGWVPKDCRRFQASRLRVPGSHCHPGCDKQAGVAVTHGHPDHVGALAELEAKWPELGVVMHSVEAPFVVGPAAQQAKYSLVPSDNTAYKLLFGLLGPFAPQMEADRGRTFLLSGPEPPRSGVCTRQRHSVPAHANVGRDCYKARPVTWPTHGRTSRDGSRSGCHPGVF